MSNYILNGCWMLEGISPTQKIVLISLADQANDDGVCWPSVRTIEKRTCLSERSVRSAVKQLEEIGILKRNERTGRSTYYVIDAKKIYSCNNCTPAPDAPTPAPDAPQPLQELHPTPAGAAPITIIEPSIETITETSITKPPAKAVVIDFDLFWDLYPKKVGIETARKAWKKLKPNQPLFDLIKTHLSYAYIATDKQFIPNGSTYLNQKRWTDEVITTAKPINNLAAMNYGESGDL